VKTALIFVVIGILLTSGLWYAFAATPSSTFYISSGVYPGAPSYTVWKEGSNYFAKDANGLIAYSGTNASQIIQNCIDNGGVRPRILFKAHSYSFDTTILPTKPIEIEGEGYATLLMDSNVDLLRFESFITRVSIKNIYLKYNVAGSHCLVNISQGAGQVWIDNVEIETVSTYTGTALNFIEGSNSLYEIFITESTINTAGNATLLNWAGSELTIGSSKFGCSASYGSITLSGGWSNIHGCGFELVRILLSNSLGNAFTGNWFSHAPDYAIRINACGNVTITGNNIQNLTLGSTAYAYGIDLYNAKHTIVTGNLVYSSLTTSMGIREEGTSDYNIIIGCSAFGSYDTKAISTVGANTECHLCYNGTSWIS